MMISLVGVFMISLVGVLSSRASNRKGRESGPIWTRIRRAPLDLRQSGCHDGLSRHAGSVRQEFSPQTSLLAPVEGRGDRLQIGQDDRIAAAYSRRQKQQRFLDI